MRAVYLALALSVPATAFGARMYGMAGCGLGSIVMGSSGGQLSAATTNATGANQAFAISSGTSNCAPDAATAALLQQESFVESNYATLSKDMAKGQGESIQGLAAVLGCPTHSVSEFATFTQARYTTLFAAPGSMAMLDTLKTELAANPSLATQCKYSKVL